jgi:hypothetical protein
MRLNQQRLIRCSALAATTAMMAMTVALVWGAGVGLAADYQDAKHNVCEGTFTFPPCTAWGGHVTGENNVALGDAMMPALTSGSNNVALDFRALATNTTGDNNIASGLLALFSNTTGSDNIASGTQALEGNTTGRENIASGSGALRSNTEGTENIASGTYALNRNTTGSANIASGSFALFENTTGANNLASGQDVLSRNAKGNSNVASGGSALGFNTEGSFNVASGVLALYNNTTGNGNIAIGFEAGDALTTGSGNVDISNRGAAGEAGTTRIGTEGQQKKTFMAGIWPSTISGPVCAVKVNSEGQLGCNPGETGPPGPEGKEGKTGPAGNAAIATFASRKAVVSGNCLAYTDIAPAGTGACPAKTTGFSSSTLLAGPTPANGASVTNLYADSSAVVSGTDTVLVAVIDNTTGATLISCTVTSSSPHSCSNTSGSGAVAAGENIEVKLTATGTSGNSKLWRVTFRF